jgi:hypothetical protein
MKYSTVVHMEMKLFILWQEKKNVLNKNLLSGTPCFLKKISSETFSVEEEFVFFLCVLRDGEQDLQICK